MAYFANAFIHSSVSAFHGSQKYMREARYKAPNNAADPNTNDRNSLFGRTKSKTLPLRPRLFPVTSR